MSAPPLREDRSAGITGLLVALVFVFAVVVSIVKATNSHYTAHPPTAEEHK